MDHEQIDGDTPRGADEECRQVRELLSPMLDGELTPEENDRTGLHLMNCESCRRASEELLELHRSLQVAPDLTAEELAASRSRILGLAFGRVEACEASPGTGSWGAWLEALVMRNWAAAPALALALIAALWLRPAPVQVARVPEPVPAAPAGPIAPMAVPSPGAAVRPHAQPPLPAPAGVAPLAPARGSDSIVLARLEAGSGDGAVIRQVEAGPDALVMRLDGGGADEIPVVWVLQGEAR